MNKKRKLVLVAGFLAISMLAASIIAGSQMTTAAAQTQQTNQDKEIPTVSTSGSATVKVDPDKVSVTIGVETNGKTAAEAVAENAKLMEKIIAALRTLGITDDQIATSNYSVFPVYEMVSPPCIEIYPQPPECKPRSEIVGYRTMNSIVVTAESSTDVGRIIDAAVEAGATNISGAYFFVSEERQQEIRDSLIEKAILNAKARAERAAGAVGMHVAGVKSISLSDVYFPPIYRGFAEDTQVFPGPQVVSMNVQVVFEINGEYNPADAVQDGTAQAVAIVRSFILSKMPALGIEISDELKLHTDMVVVLDEGKGAYRVEVSILDTNGISHQGYVEVEDGQVKTAVLDGRYLM